MMTSTSKAEVGCVVDVRHIDSIDRGWIIFKVDYWKKYMNGMRATSVILKLIVSYVSILEGDRDIHATYDKIRYFLQFGFVT